MATKSSGTTRTATNNDRHGWIGTEKVKTRFGTFEFKNGYPSAVAADALLEQLKFNRAIEVFLTQLPAVSMFAEHRGLEEFGVKRCNQIVVWESLMDAETILLTANTETVYALGHLRLKSDGPTVVEAPPKMLGFAMDALQPRTRARAAATSFFRPTTPAKFRRGTSLSSRRPTTSASVFGASRWMARPTRPSR